MNYDEKLAVKAELMIICGCVRGIGENSKEEITVRQLEEVEKKIEATLKKHFPSEGR